MKILKILNILHTFIEKFELTHFRLLLQSVEKQLLHQNVPFPLLHLLQDLIQRLDRT